MSFHCYDRAAQIKTRLLRLVENVFSPIKTQQATSATRATTYKLMKPPMVSSSSPRTSIRKSRVRIPKRKEFRNFSFFYQIDFDGHLPSQKSASDEGALKNVRKHQNVRKCLFGCLRVTFTAAKSIALPFKTLIKSRKLEALFTVEPRSNTF